MNLFIQTKQHMRWFISVWRQLVRYTPIIAPSTAFLLLGSQLSQVVAFLLPLKVILLLGGSGVPHYFQNFISIDTKNIWIIFLCFGAVFLYMLSQLMDWLAERQSQRGALVVLNNARKIVIFNDQDESVREQYRRICEIVSEGAAIVIGLSVILFLFTPLFVFLILVIMLVTAAIMASSSIGNQKIKLRIERWLDNHHRGLIRVLGSVCFLASFLFLVVEFYRQSELNLLVAIVSLIISRRIFQALTNFSGGQIKLAEQKKRIDALFFHEKQVQSHDDRDGQRFWHMFAPGKRLQRSADWIAKGGLRDVPVDSRWLDSSQSNIIYFEIYLKKKTSERVLEKIHLPRQHSQANHEIYLLKRVSTEAINAPSLLQHGQLEDFVWLQLSCPSGIRTDRKIWHDKQRRIIVDLWCYAPPEDLIDSYLRSQPPLWARMDTAFLSRLSLAAERIEECRLLEELQTKLEDIQQRLKRIPLFIHNHDLNERNVRTDANERPWLLAWGRWTLEPIGVGAMPQLLQEAREGRLISQLKEKRKIPLGVTDSDLLLAFSMRELESMIARQQYRRALIKIPEILNEACS